MLKWFAVSFSFLLVFCGFSQSKQFAMEYINQDLELDGKLIEQEWTNAVVISDFTQNFPNDSVAAQSRTEVKMLYNNKYIYIAAICSQPEPYVVNNLVRDFSFPISDAFAVFLNPRKDKTNGYSFSVNPFGAQREGIVTNGGAFGVTTAWDQKWFAEATRTGDAYIVEMAIPFKALKFKQTDEVWDVNFARNDLSINETSTWSSIPLGFNVANLNDMGSLIFKGEIPKSGANVALIPYMSFGAAYEYEDKAITARDNISKAGLDAKIAVGSSLNLDVTVNPDFSNVQVDQQVINLDRFSIFFPERRNFFTENSDLFSNFGFSRIRPFFSRRIGLNQGSPVNILGGLRLSGNVTDDLRIGVMNMQTEGVGGDIQLESQNYSVVAFQQQVFGRSNIGAILVNRQAFNGFSSINGDNNTTAGIDFNLYSKNNQWRGKVFYHQTFEDGIEMDGGAQAVWLNYNTTNWNVHYNHEYVGGNYSAEVGFVPRTGYFRFEHSIGYSWYPTNTKVNKHEISTYYSQYWVEDNVSTDRTNNIQYNTAFLNTGQFEMGYEENQVRLFNDFDVVGKGTPIASGNYNFRNGYIGYNSNFRKPFSWYLGADFGSFYNGTKLSYELEANYRIRPKASIGLNFIRNELRFPDDYNNGYLTLVGANFDVSFSTKVIWYTFLQYNTQANNFNINSRLQWRFAPQSDIFFVYTDNYTDDFLPKNKAFVLRLNYWFGI